MKGSKKLQEKELKNVSGGYDDGGDTNGHVTCRGCGAYVNLDFTETNSGWDGCDYYKVYKCTGCGKWIYNDGEVRN